MAENTVVARTKFLAKFLLITVPVINFVGLLNYVAYGIGHKYETRGFLSPWRGLFSTFAPLYVARKGLQKNSLDRSGALAGLIVGFILTLSNTCFFAALLAFFVTGSKVTNFRSHLKRSQEEGYKEGGQRTWVQVVCTAGVATNVAIVYVLETGCGEFVIDFSSSYVASALCMSVLGTLAASNGDTWSSEIGSVIGSGNPRLVTSWEKVPRGTNGAISFVGLLASIVGGAVCGLAYYVALLLCVSRDVLEAGPPQWPVIFAGAALGFVGSLIDSLLGAWLQYSGIHEDTGKVVEYPGPKIRDISGTAILDNHGVNMVTSIVMVFLSPSIALAVWGYCVPN